jgi:hypothetical protein
LGGSWEPSDLRILDSFGAIGEVLGATVPPTAGQNGLSFNNIFPESMRVFLQISSLIESQMVEKSGFGGEEGDGWST